MRQPGQPGFRDDPGRGFDDELSTADGITRPAPRRRGQWAPAMFSVTTPPITSAMPTTLPSDIGEPRNTTAITTIAVVPSADHSAYATSICMPRAIAIAINAKATAYPDRHATVGHNRVKPSVDFSRLVAITSATIATANNK